MRASITLCLTFFTFFCFGQSGNKFNTRVESQYRELSKNSRKAIVDYSVNFEDSAGRQLEKKQTLYKHKVKTDSTNADSIVVPTPVWKDLKKIGDSISRAADSLFELASQAAVDSARKNVLAIDFSSKLETATKIKATASEKADSFLELSLQQHYYFKTAHTVSSFFCWNSTDAQLFYDAESKNVKSKFLNNTLLSINPTDGTTSIYNEVYSDFFGPVRFGLGILLSNKKSPSDSAKTKNDTASNQNDAMQRLIGGGGNTTASFSYPILAIKSRGQNAAFKLATYCKGNLDVPKIGTESNDFAASFDLGIEGSAYIVGKNETIAFFTAYKFGYLNGNPLFFKNVNKTDNVGFAFHQITGGIAIKNTFRIHLTYYYGDEFVTKKFPYSLGFSVISDK